MANHDGNMESSRALALTDRERINRKYRPPDIPDLRYCIHDKQQHCSYYYKTKTKYLKNVQRFSCMEDADCRFIFIDSKQQ